MGISSILFFPLCFLLIAEPSATDTNYYYAPIPYRIPEKLPDAEMVMKKVRERISNTPIELVADLETRLHTGEKFTLKAEIKLNWGASPPFASYLLSDGFGTASESLKLIWQDTKNPETVYKVHSTTNNNSSFSLNQRIDQLGLHWSDLTLSFLWWEKGITQKIVSKKTRSCYLLELQRPPWDVSSYNSIHLWVDKKEFFILEVLAYDNQNNKIRKIESKSLKKMNNVWMVKDLEIVDFSKRAKSRIRVKEVKLN